MNVYNTEFYAHRRARTLVAARKILSLVRDITDFKSIADVGCGTGTWLAAAFEGGAEKAVGLEGDWVKPDMLDDPRIEFFPKDLEQRFELPQVDLAMSLEVAEHVSEGVHRRSWTTFAAPALS
jgi:SAM-dependent methyltransferase